MMIIMKSSFKSPSVNHELRLLAAGQAAFFGLMDVAKAALLP